MEMTYVISKAYSSFQCSGGFVIFVLIIQLLLKTAITLEYSEIIFLAVGIMTITIINKMKRVYHFIAILKLSVQTNSQSCPTLNLILASLYHEQSFDASWKDIWKFVHIIAIFPMRARNQGCGISMRCYLARHHTIKFY